MTKKEKQALARIRLDTEHRLTEEQQATKRVIEILRRLLEEARLNLEHAEMRCGHVVVPTGEGTATCCLCDQVLGRWCPTAPHLMCEYADEDYDFDVCLHCGIPRNLDYK